MKIRHILCFALALCFSLCMLTAPGAPAALAAQAAPGDAYYGGRAYPLEDALATSLKAMGLFQGVSDGDYALEQQPTRAQSLVMLLRLMGLEQAALAEGGAHPFTDVADCKWAEPYIGYAYQHGLTKGTDASGKRFSGSDTADARTYLTFVLRALGYEEGSGGDFLWSDPGALAEEVGIAPVYERFFDFRRADMVATSYAALSAKMKNDDLTLAQALCAHGALTEKALARYYDPDAIANGALSQPYAENVRLFLRSFHPEEGIDISGLPIRYHSSVAMIGDAGYELYGFYEAGARRVAQQIANGAAAVAGQARVFGIIVPNRMGAVLSYADFDRLCSRTQKNETDGIAYAYAQMGDGVVTVDAMSRLRLHNEEYIYFRTDHHWTGLGSYYAYEAWAEAAGFEPVPLDRFTQHVEEGHLGYFYSACGNPAEMRQNPDTVISYIPSGSFTCSPANAMDFTAWGYNIFIGGDRGLTTIVNDDIADESACVLVKDSYGNPFAVWLTQHYHTVYVIDYRHYRNTAGYLSFSQFTAQKGVQDFIVLLPMTLSQADTTANYLAKYCW